MTHTDEWVVKPCPHTTWLAEPPDPTDPSRSLGVCSTNTALPPVCHSSATIAWESWCPLCLGYKAQLPVQPMPFFSDPNALRASEWWVISFWNNLPYLFHHCVSFWQCFFLQTTRQILAFTAILNSQSLQATYPFPPLFSVFHFNGFLGRDKFSPFSPSAHLLPFPHPHRLRQEGSRAPRAKWALRHV